MRNKEEKELIIKDLKVVLNSKKLMGSSEISVHPDVMEKIIDFLEEPTETSKEACPCPENECYEYPSKKCKADLEVIDTKPDLATEIQHELYNKCSLMVDPAFEEQQVKVIQDVLEQYANTKQITEHQIEDIIQWLKEGWLEDLDHFNTPTLREGLRKHLNK